MKKGFPSFLYHREQGAKLVKSEEELLKLGAGWADNPSKVGLIPVERNFVTVFEKDPSFEEPKTQKPSRER